MNILLVGTGYMAKEYARVLKALDVSFDVAGRNLENCKLFRDTFAGVKVYEGGVEKMDGLTAYTHAIISSNVDYLSAHTRLLVDAGIKNILLEKPGGSSIEDVEDLISYVQDKPAAIYLAYNRRYYASVLAAREMIEEDGGVLSFNFEFTEWAHLFDDAVNFDLGRRNLLITNSSHVIDMAFFMGGAPAEISTFTSDALEWHKPAIFTGAGRSVTGALFTYQANWKSPGRWGVEMITRNRRLIFRPLEQLQVMHHKSVKIEQVQIDDTLDTTYKPGLYKQTKSFLLKEQSEGQLNINSFSEYLPYYKAIWGGEIITIHLNTKNC